MCAQADYKLISLIYFKADCMCMLGVLLIVCAGSVIVCAG